MAAQSKRNDRSPSPPSAASSDTTAGGVYYQLGYGKLQIPVYRVYAQPLTGIAPIPESRFTGRSNTLLAVEVDVEVFGDDFLAAYTEGDNSRVVATDSMKNFVLQQALTYEGATIEGFLAFLAKGFTRTYEQLRSLRISARELPFHPCQISRADGQIESEVLYAKSAEDVATASLTIDGDASGTTITDHQAGRAGIRLMKITGSAFTSFVRDSYTTLPDRRDRPLYIFLDVGWRYTDVEAMIASDHTRYVPAEQVRDLIQTVFHEFVSESIQHLVHEMGLRLLNRFPQLAEVSFVAQNRTRDPFYASETDDRIRVYSDPFSAYGEITLTMTRSDV